MIFVAFATGSRAAVPADVRHATAVTDADRRSGMTTPWPPKAAVERITAPRFRGSVMLSSTTIIPCSLLSATVPMRSNTSAYSNGGICNPTPWCSPLPVMLSSSMRGTSISGIDRLWASCTASVSRSSLRVPCAIYRAVAGTRACKHSITGLRPTTSSVLALRSCRPWSRRWRSSLRL